jgi:NAD(P)H-dependent FMN reductase
VGAWVASELEKHPEFAYKVIDPIALHFPNRGGQEEASQLALLKQDIAEADAYIVVTPEYNHSYPAVLKHLIDSAYGEWQAKPVGFVSYGGVSGGLRAVEHLRAVFSELHAVTMRDSVSFANVWTHIDSNGQFTPSVGTRTMGVMLKRLNWWATALRNARALAPYAQEPAA